MMHDVVIVGGGVVGLTLAALIAKSGLKILIVEKNFTTNFSADYDLRCSALNPNSVRIFEELGIFAPMLQMAKYGKFEQINIHHQETKLEFASYEINVPYLGYILQNSAISQVLTTFLQQFTNVQLLAANVQGINSANNCIFLHDNTVINYKLLVIADGKYSKLRQLLGIDCYSYDYQDSALVAIVQTATACPRVASQFFVDQAILAFLPLAEDNQFSIVLSQKAKVNEEFLTNLQSLEAFLSEKSSYAFGQVKVISKLATFALNAQHATNYVIHENIVLAGDSAHAIHPLAGQGLNLGLADVACLAQFINNHQTNYRFLRQYERTVKLQNSVFLHSMSGIRKFFTTWPAKFAIQALAHLPILKAKFITNACHGINAIKN